MKLDSAAPELIPVTTTLSPPVPQGHGSEERVTGGGWGDEPPLAYGALLTVCFCLSQGECGCEV